MMNLDRNGMAILAILLAIGTGCTMKSSCDVKVYYIPLNIEAYVAPTADDIKKNGKVIAKRDLPNVCRLMESVENSQSKKNITNETKRLRIVLEENRSRVIYITTESKVVYKDSVYEIQKDIVENAINEITSMDATK